ncbi:STM3941 family protein [Sphingobacterium thalpophilum]|uniref:STM3941 family protein n=1 Tax=Sphingobacterium thalpophilum TaxID=259 RepID=UPI0031CDE5E3
MKERVIKFDKKKRIKNLLVGFIFTIAALCFSYYIFFIADKIRLYHGLMTAMLGALGIYVVVKAAKELGNGDSIGLILDAEGITYKATPLGKQVGLLRWSSIESLRTEKRHGIHFVFLKLRDARRDIPALGPALYQNVETNGIPVSADQLAIGFEELAQLIAQYHQRYRY